MSSENVPLNPLGEPAPSRTDFTAWSRAGLELFARQAADENLVLRAEIAQVKEDLAIALAAWRKCEAGKL